jgi:polyisoprenoid-binding protein YceI
MQTSSGQMTAPQLRALLGDGTLAGQWVLDPGKSSIQLKSRSMWGLVPVTGVFREVRGDGTVSQDGKVSGTITVAAASIETKNTKRDTHLRSADFFDTDNHPDITFTARAIGLSDKGVNVTGELTVRGRSKPLSFDAAASLQGDDEILLDAAAHINRADFGLEWNSMGMAAMNNTLTIHAVFNRR